MRILRKPLIPTGPAKWLVFVPLGLIVIVFMMTLFVVFPPSAISIFRNGPMLVAVILIYAWARSLTSGQLPGRRPDRTPPTAPSGPSRWDTARSLRNVYLFGAAIVVVFAAVIYWKMPEIVARDIAADMFFLRAGLVVLLAIFVGMVIAAFRPANVMTLDNSVLTLAGKDKLAIPLSTIDEVVIRPKTDPFVAVLRLNDPPRDVALELGRLSLDPSVFAAELAMRRPGVAFSDSRPGSFAGSGILAGLSDGDPGDFR